MLVEHLQVVRDTSRNPLFQHVFVMQNAFSAGAGLELKGLQADLVDVPITTAKFDLYVDALELGDGSMALAWEFSTDLYHPETVERMAQHYQNLCRAACATEHTLTYVNYLPMLSDAEQK
jgi:non-ribosomal peptide synthetase component F